MGTRGEPELFRRRVLLFSAESMGCCAAAETFPGRTDDGGAVVAFVALSMEITDGLGLKVTFRAFRCASVGLHAVAGRRGELSLGSVEAIASGLRRKSPRRLRW